MINSPKGQTTPVPPDLTQRPVVHPSPFWTWSLVSRQNETRTVVRAALDALSRDAGQLGLDAGTTWLPADDPHRPAGTANQDHSGAGAATP